MLPNDRRDEREPLIQCYLQSNAVRIVRTIVTLPQSSRQQPSRWNHRIIIHSRCVSESFGKPCGEELRNGFFRRSEILQRAAPELLAPVAFAAFHAASYKSMPLLIDIASRGFRFAYMTTELQSDPLPPPLPCCLYASPVHAVPWPLDFAFW